MTEQRAVVPAGQTGVDKINLGQTALDAGDLVLPRVKVVQQMSDEAQRGKQARANPGEFWNTLTGENLGDHLKFVPVQVFKQRVMLVRGERIKAVNEQLAKGGLGPVPEGSKGLICRSFDMYQGRGYPGILCNDCPLSKWGENNTPPLCSETYNVASLTEQGELIILSFVRSSAKVGKRVFSMLRMKPGVPWDKVYLASTRAESNDKGTFYVPEVTVTKEAPSTELLGHAKRWADTLGAAVILDVTPVDEDLETAGRPAPEDDIESAPF